ncbi:hypothetical protein BKK56_11085 [Rodentibacter genomosp. 2]|uniref:hypothetical protein n=1 Tax=Rodentibacter genomosp. 2 TaxID=1908266 RepID=UPI000986DA31|nr:hypothetical protein BKK56_11085 [Rodentibacter genomosp. 2]
MNIIKKVLTLLFPPIFREIATRAFYYTKYLHYRFKVWKHPKALKRVYLFFIALVAIVAISISLISFFAFVMVLLITSLPAGKFSSHEESSDPEIVYYANGYEEDGVFYPDTGHENEPPQYS